MKIKIITDGTADIPAEIAKQYDVTVIPVEVIFDGTPYLSGVEITTEEFFTRLNERIANNKPLPTTTQITAGTFEDVLSPYCNDPETFVAMFLMSKDMSGTYNSAKTAIASLGMQNVHLFDTKVITVALGALVTECAKIAHEPDITVDDFIARAEDLNSRVWIYASIGDLRCLRAGGRLSASSMALGALLKIKPLIYIQNKVEICGKMMGQVQANKWIVEKVSSERDPSLPLYFAHSQAPKLPLDLQTKYADKLCLGENDRVYSIGPVVGVHAGSGAVGIAFFRKK